MPSTPAPVRLLQRSMMVAALSLVLCASVALTWPGCGNGDTVVNTCTDTPLSCAMGTTCWPVAASGAAACLPSKSYKMRGDDCELILGDTSCGDGMVCATAATLKGDGSVVQSFCTGWCNATSGAGCVGDETCMKLPLLEGTTAVSVCVPRSLPRDHAQDGGP